VALGKVRRDCEKVNDPSLTNRKERERKIAWVPLDDRNKSGGGGSNREHKHLPGRGGYFFCRRREICGGLGGARNPTNEDYAPGREGGRGGRVTTLQYEEGEGKVGLILG